MRRDAVRATLFFFDVLKNFVERATQGVRQPECELERRRIFSGFQRDDGLSRDTADRREFRLRQRRGREAPFAYAIGDTQAKDDR